MGVALVGTRAFKQAITGGAFEALAAATGDSLAVPNFDKGTRAWMLEAWGADSTSAADFDIRSPSLHDNIRGIRFAYQPKPAAGNVQQFLPGIIRQPLYATDVLIAEVSGTAADKVGLNYLSYFESLPGADQRLTSWGEIEGRIVNMVGIFVNPTAGAAGDFGANRLLNQDDSRLNANTDYAILGASSQISAETLSIIAPETSGRRITLPLGIDEQDGAHWFANLSAKYNLPLIPIINSNNAGNVVLQAADCVGATVPHVTVLMAELS
jgi:hypothetical protein